MKSIDPLTHCGCEPTDDLFYICEGDAKVGYDWEERYAPVQFEDRTSQGENVRRKGPPDSYSIRYATPNCESQPTCFHFWGTILHSPYNSAGELFHRTRFVHVDDLDLGVL